MMFVAVYTTLCILITNLFTDGIASIHSHLIQYLYIDFNIRKAIDK